MYLKDKSAVKAQVRLSDDDVKFLTELASDVDYTFSDALRFCIFFTRSRFALEDHQDGDSEPDLDSKL